MFFLSRKLKSFLKLFHFEILEDIQNNTYYDSIERDISSIVFKRDRYLYMIKGQKTSNTLIKANLNTQPYILQSQSRSVNINSVSPPNTFKYEMKYAILAALWYSTHSQEKP